MKFSHHRPLSFALPPFTSRPASLAEAGSRMPDAGYSCDSVRPRSVAATVLRPPASVRSLSTFIPSHFSTLRAPRGAAFSLTEVVIALGIFAISMVGILALFPVASATGRESSEETQAAIIAQTLLDDLRISLNARGSTNGWLVAGSDTFSAFITNISLRSSADYAIAYNIKLRDRADSGGGAPQIGPPIALKALTSLPVSSYPDRSTNSAWVYLTQIRIRPLNTLPNLASVNVEVSTPATVPLANRRTFFFNTLMAAP